MCVANQQANTLQLHWPRTVYLELVPLPESSDEVPEEEDPDDEGLLGDPRDGGLLGDPRDGDLPVGLGFSPMPLDDRPLLRRLDSSRSACSNSTCCSVAPLQSN